MSVKVGLNGNTCLMNHVLFLMQELQWLEHLWNHVIMFKTGVVRANLSARSGCIIGMNFRFSLTLRYVVCSHKKRLIEAILMETHTIPFSILKEKITLNYLKSAAR